MFIVSVHPARPPYVSVNFQQCQRFLKQAEANRGGELNPNGPQVWIRLFVFVWPSDELSGVHTASPNVHKNWLKLQQTKEKTSTCGLWNKLLVVLEGVTSQDAEKGRAGDIDVRKWTAATD